MIASTGRIVSYDAVDSAATNVGRRPTPLRFNRNFAHIIAVYAEGAYASVGMVNAVGETVACREVKISSYDDYFSRGLFEDIDAVAAESGIAVESCIGIGVALPVSFDETSLEIRRPPLIDSQITDLTGLRQALCDRYRLPVLLENDVNASAYGEYRREYAASVRDMVYLSLGTGLGSGLILNGALRRGRHNSAGEIGYMTLDAAGSDAGRWAG